MKQLNIIHNDMGKSIWLAILISITETGLTIEARHEQEFPPMYSTAMEWYRVLSDYSDVFTEPSSPAKHSITCNINQIDEQAPRPKPCIYCISLAELEDVK